MQRDFVTSDSTVNYISVRPPCFVSRCSGCQWYSQCANADKDGAFYPTITYQTTGNYKVGVDPAVGSTPCTGCGKK